MDGKLGMLLAGVLAAGCATTGGFSNTPAPNGETGNTAATAPDPFPAAQPPTFAQPPDMTPRIVIPATGGTPVIGIPLGGNLFQPVTGGAPVIGIPTSP